MRIFFLIVALVLTLRASPVAQEHQHADAPPQETPAEHHHDHGTSPGLFSAREGSGTSWVPATTDMYALHRQAGNWELMWHANAFIQFLHEAANEHRGSSQTGSINWTMMMARRQVGAGQIGLRGMFSLEPATIGGCGYPDLFATGELCETDTIHDLQHPHDFLMEVAGEYERPLRGEVRWQLYGGLAGEPALGPGAYPHRPSALPNPLAPIAHHWLDATHITFGVVTAGLFSDRWKAEASVFNGREPDENRWDLDLAPLDSFSGRVWFAPTDELTMQVSAGHLRDAEDKEGELPRVDVDRVTASLTYHRRFASRGLWASTVAGGRNEESDLATYALLVETSLTRQNRDAWFGRFEVGGKVAHDLHVDELRRQVLVLSKLQGGYTRYIAQSYGWHVGLGGELSVGFVPEALTTRYGSRANLGFGFFLSVRPGVHAM